MPADLHIHTNCSDGIISPEGLVKQAKEAGLTVIAITDHDTVAGIPRAIAEGEKLGVRVIPGIEFTTDVPGTEIHILGYFIDYKIEWLNDILEKIRGDRINRLQKILDKLKKLGVNLKAEDVTKYIDKGSIGRPHVARALIEKGYVRSIQEAFNRYLDFNAPAYVPHYKLTPSEAVKTVIKAGGVAVYAHPGVSADDEIIPELIKAGLAGLEVYYSNHSDLQIRHYLSLAEKYGLLVTGGSDFHGSIMREVKLGDIKLDDKIVAKLEEYRKK